LRGAKSLFKNKLITLESVIFDFSISNSLYQLFFSTILKSLELSSFNKFMLNDISIFLLSIIFTLEILNESELFISLANALQTEKNINKNKIKLFIIFCNNI
jgi:hypothetical protein